MDFLNNLLTEIKTWSISNTMSVISSIIAIVTVMVSIFKRMAGRKSLTPQL